MDKVLVRIKESSILNLINRLYAPISTIYISFSIVVILSTLVSLLGLQMYVPVISEGTVSVILSVVAIVVISFSFDNSKAKKFVTKEKVVIALGTLFAVFPFFVQGDKVTLSLFVATLVVVILKLIYGFSSVAKVKISSISQTVCDTLVEFVPVLATVIVAFGINIGIAPFIHEISNFVHQLFLIISGFPVTLVLVIVTCYLWVKGYHGTNIVGSVMQLFWVPMTFANVINFAYHHQVFYFGTDALISAMVWIGGSGSTLGLTLLLRVFARSKKMKDIANQSLVPSLFNVNELVIFGIPIVENKRYFIPFFLAPLLTVTATYFAILMGHVTYPALLLSWVVPSPIAVYIGSLFDLKTLALSLVLIVGSGIVYLPFVLKHDSEVYTQELNDTLNQIVNED